MQYLTIPIEFPSESGHVTIRGRFVLPERKATAVHKCPLVIMLTGDGPKGTQSLTWANLPPRLADHGVASFLFDFQGLGNSDGSRRQLTVTRAGGDFAAAFAAALSQDWVDVDRVGILAASFGATVALLHPHILNQVRLLGLKSPACFLADAYLNEAGPDAVDRWLADGFLPDLGYDVSVLHDCLPHNAYSSARSLTPKVLITHGANDNIVPLRQSQLLMTILQPTARLEVLPGVGHHYSEPGAWDRMAVLFVDWFRQNL